MQKNCFGPLIVMAALLTACDGAGSGLDAPAAHPLACGANSGVRLMSASADIPSGYYADEMDLLPCDADTDTGETEPLYTYQWALNYKDSYFNYFPETFGGGMDLNVEPVHRQGFKGQGVNVLVVDEGVDALHEDIQPNFKAELSWTYSRNTSRKSHGTGVAGIIAAAQNGKGVMGIAPRANLGAVDYVANQEDRNYIETHGGAPWSSEAHIFNASFGDAKLMLPYESEDSGVDTPSIRAIKRLRDGKGAIYVKSAGNEYAKDSEEGCETSGFSCVNPANDIVKLEPNVIVAAALNAKGSASYYSSAGSVLWVTGMGGESGGYGAYGEGLHPWWETSMLGGPTIFTTDKSDGGCFLPFLDYTHFNAGQTVRGEPENPNCAYRHMNGTSAAAPTISGVAALMLSANPDLTWRDVRDILRLSARKVDEGYERVVRRADSHPSATMMDLRTNQLLHGVLGGASDIFDGATSFPLELGWQKNAAGNDYSNWYGFGVPDAEKAVALALAYRENPALSRAEDVQIPDFRPVAYWHKDRPPTAESVFATLDETRLRSGPFPYRQVTSVGKFTWNTAQTVDQFQVRLSGANVCRGSLGIAVRSPSGTTSLLKQPNDHFTSLGGTKTSFRTIPRYGLGSYAFYGEPAQGDWEIFVIAANPDATNAENTLTRPCSSWSLFSGDSFLMGFEARVIAQ
ncbi:MAG: S8 family serine peptidase [Candidimonas sp.]